MSFRVTENTTNERLKKGIASQQQRAATAQEQLSSGKRINKPSDDPFGSAAVIQLRNTQTSNEQFKAAGQFVGSKLSVSEGALDSYQRQLDRVRSLLSQGASDTTNQIGRNAVATQLDAIRADILHITNLRDSDGQYVFGGTRQDIPPFDPTTEVAAATPTSDQLIQIEKDTAPIAAGVTAETIFSTSTASIFATLTAAAAALRGTGNAAADKATLNTALSELSILGDQAGVAITKVGESATSIEKVADRLTQNSLSIEENIQNIEGIDFAAAAINFAEANRALEATLQSSAQTNRRTLLDFLA